MNAKFKINGTNIFTERLILRPFLISDLEDFYNYAKVEGVGEQAGWPHHDSIDTSRTILEKFISEDKVFAIVHKSDNKVIGSIGIEEYQEDEFDLNFKCLKGREIGYVLAKDYWNHGYMSEAIKAIISYLFDDIRLDFIVCGFFNENIRSKRIQEKCGFSFYKKTTFKTMSGTKVKGTLNVLISPYFKHVLV